jgi:hypothetical protein
LLREGRILARGPVRQVVVTKLMTEAFWCAAHGPQTSWASYDGSYEIFRLGSPELYRQVEAGGWHETG